MYLSNHCNPIELQQLRGTETFKCPSCRSELILKVGQFKIPHFAHKSSSLCDSFSEPESPFHLQGKLLLYEFFKRERQSPELEKFLPAIKQRADLLVDNRLAIEYQCSTISLLEVAKRTAGYQKIGIDPIWIQKGKLELSSGVQLLKIRPFEMAFSAVRAPKGYLLGLDPLSETFVYYSSLFYMGGNQWVGKVSYLPMSKQIFPFAVPRRLTVREFDLLYSVFKGARAKFIHQQLKARNRYANPFWRSCYELSLDMHKLPAIIGIPFPGAELLQIQPVLWQLKAAEAVSLNRSAQSLLDSGQISVQAGSLEEEIRALLERYMEIYKLYQEGLIKEGQLVEIAYHNYCNIL